MTGCEGAEAAFRRWFGERLQAGREEAGLSRAALARRMPPPTESRTIRAWERGEIYPRPANIAALLKALEVEPRQLFGD